MIGKTIAELQAGDRAEVWQSRDPQGRVDDKSRLDVARFYLRACRAVQVGDGQQVIVGQRLGLASEEFGVQSNGSDTAPLAVASIAHLLQRLQQVVPAHRHAGRHADHAAAALGLSFAAWMCGFVA